MRVGELCKLLLESSYNKKDMDFLINGFSQGFDLMYQGPCERQDKSANIPFRGVGDKWDMWAKIMKEVDLKRFAGPYQDPPFRFFVQSPIGLVPKAGNKTRLIFHLSYDFEMNKSVNHHIPHEVCTVKYKDLDYAVALCLKLLDILPTGLIWSRKTYLLLAFRVLPFSKWCWFLLIMVAEDPETGVFWYFVNKCLPFGSSISCALFQKFPDALAHVLEFVTHRTRVILLFPVTNYLDDFLFLALTQSGCDDMMVTFLQLCSRLGIPVAEDKTVWAAICTVFLGTLLDGKNKVLAVPEDKRQGTINLLDKFIKKKRLQFVRCSS